MSRTGGGPGSNQYGPRGTGKAKVVPAPASTSFLVRPPAPAVEATSEDDPLIVDDRMAFNLVDVDDFCGEADELVSRGRGAFDQDVMLRRAGEAVIDHLITAADVLSRRYALSAERPDIPWHSLHQMHVKIMKIYWKTDYDVVWEVLSEHMPALRQSLAAEITAARDHLAQRQLTRGEESQIRDDARAQDFGEQ